MDTTKRLLILLLVAFIGMTATAQGNKEGTLNERLYKAKVRELVYRLHITPEQQKKFEPIYRNYCEEMSALWAERKRPIKPSNSTDAAAIAKRKMEMQQRQTERQNIARRMASEYLAFLIDKEKLISINQSNFNK